MLDVMEYKRQARLCVRCSFCKYIDMNWINGIRFSRQCPIDSKYAFNLYSPQGLLYSAIAEEAGTLQFTPKLIDALFKCTMCGACDSRCKRNLDIEVLQVIETLRARCIKSGHILPAHQQLAENIRKTGNEFGKPAKDRFNWLPKNVGLNASIIYFAGDQAAYNQPELAQETSAILNKTGATFMVLPEERNDGNEVMSIGLLEFAKELAEHNIKSIQESGAKIVVTGSAETYKSLEVDYPKLLNKSTEEMPYKVMHISEYLADLIKGGKLRFNSSFKKKVTYHDSCNLGRLSEPWQAWTPKYEGTIPVGKKWRRGDRGIYDAPREVLKAIPGLELVEMERNRSNAWSAGATGGVARAFPDFALWTAGERIEEAAATGAEAIVTCSPAEKELLNKALENQKTSMKVYDLTELVSRAI